jgi:hypothetical protein
MAGADFAWSCPSCGGTRSCCHWSKDASRPSEAQETIEKPPARVGFCQNNNLTQTSVRGSGRNFVTAPSKLKSDVPIIRLTESRL